MNTKHSVSPLRILMVEDNEHDRLAFRRTFQKSGITVEITEYIRAEDALKHLEAKKSTSDIIITDYKLPGMSGLTFCKKLLAQNILLPMILLTGAGSEHLAVDASKAGVHDYLIKDPHGGYLRLLPVVIPEVIRQYGDRLARKEAEEQLRKLSMAVEQSPAITVITDTQGNIDYVNPRFTSITGYASEEVLGQNPRILRTDRQSAEFYQDLWRTITSGTEWNGEFCNRKKDGTYYWELASICPIKNAQGNITHFLKIAEDITERKHAEEQIRNMNKELEQKLLLSKKMAELGKLVAEATHEINTPVSTGIIAASNLLEKINTLSTLHHQGTLTRSDFEEHLKNGEETAQVLLSSLSQTANLLKSFKMIAVDQCVEETRHFNLKEYLDEILLSLRPKLKKTRHTLTLACPSELELDSDPGVLSQIITNLVNTSLIHGFDQMEEGTITIQARQEKTHILLNYRDNGKGIASEHLDKIFTPFFTTKRGTGGSGIGMYLVHKLVTNKLHGQITCESSPGNGVHVTIHFPLQQLDK